MGSLFAIPSLVSGTRFPKHQKDLGSPVVSSPAISSTSGLVFVASQGDYAQQDDATKRATIYALDADNVANSMWYFDITGDIHSEFKTRPEIISYIKSSPAVVNGLVFIVAGDSINRYLYCLGD